jgi:hypothetical protein
VTGVNPVRDEGNPIVRAAQAPFDAGLGQFHRDISDADAAYRDTVAKLDRDTAARDTPATVHSGQSDFDYDNPIADRPQPRPAWGTPAPQPKQPQAQRPTRRDDTDDDYAPETWLR